MEKSSNSYLQELVKGVSDGTIDLPNKQLPPEEKKKLDNMLYGISAAKTVATSTQRTVEFLNYLQKKLIDGYDVTEYWKKYYNRWIKP